MGLEQLPQKSSLYGKAEIGISSTERQKIFLEIAINHLLESYENELQENGWDEGQIQEFHNTLLDFDEEEVKSILSFPSELRGKIFQKMLTQIEHGSTVLDVVTELKNTAVNYGFTLGYHTSAADINPSPKGWVIKPTDFDDRDEMKMAYYSTDYENLYRKGSPRFLYFVRAETGPKTSHKMDQNNHWGRAPFLSIVDKMNLLEIDEAIREAELAEKRREQEEEKKAA